MNRNNELLASAKLTSKGQITIPKIVRDNLNIEEGDSIIFYLDENNNIKISNIKDCKISQGADRKHELVKRGNK